jgi:hypothetical protein
VAGRYDFTIVSGTDLGLTLTWFAVSGSPVDLTGWSGHMQIRAWPIASLLADMTTGGGQIVLGGTAGTIALSLPAATTTLFPAGVAKYDLKLTNTTSSTSVLLYGNAIIRAAVTLP